MASRALSTRLSKAAWRKAALLRAIIPMAERMGLSQPLDRRAIELAARLLADTSSPAAPLAINLAPTSVVD